MADLTPWAPRVRSVLRIVAGLMFMLHGTSKLFAFPEGHGGAPPLMTKMGIAGLVEVICGGLIVIGLLTRIAAFIASGEMAVAYFTVHAAHGAPFWPTMNKGELAVLYCFVFLYFVFAGAGPWSVDAAVRRKP